MRAVLCFMGVICLLALGITMIGRAQEAGEKHQKSANLAEAAAAALRLDGRAQKERLSALSKEYADLEVELIVELAKAAGVEQKSAVVYLMGRYRSQESVRELAGYASLKYESTELNDKLPLWGMYPAVEALTRIGKPAISPMLENIETGKDKEFRRLSTEVILRIEGAEVGRFILESKLKKAKDVTARQRLQEALAYLEKATG